LLSTQQQTNNLNVWDKMVDAPGKLSQTKWRMRRAAVHCHQKVRAGFQLNNKDANTNPMLGSLSTCEYCREKKKSPVTLLILCKCKQINIIPKN
jgi:hypothetical protein